MVETRLMFIVLGREEKIYITEKSERKDWAYALKHAVTLNPLHFSSPAERGKKKSKEERELLKRLKQVFQWKNLNSY